jgi:hypothetical protein
MKVGKDELNIENKFRKHDNKKNNLKDNLYSFLLESLNNFKL